MMRIGKLAKEGGVSVQAVRYYERRGLMPAPARRPSGYREYPRRAVRQVRAIKWAQSLGFRLDQTADVISIGEHHLRGRRTAFRTLVIAKLRELDNTLQQLRSMRRALLAIAACRCDGDCPIVAEALSTPARALIPRPLRRRR
jgi:DNA-binding transcriptional MerR regulator